MASIVSGPWDLDFDDIGPVITQHQGAKGAG
jgi:hypothetical protein